MHILIELFRCELLFIEFFEIKNYLMFKLLDFPKFISFLLSLFYLFNDLVDLVNSYELIVLFFFKVMNFLFDFDYELSKLDKAVFLL